MERVLTQEERIRRAEEIYLRRRNVRPQYRETRETANNKQAPIGRNIKLFKKMILQIVICLLLYCIFYLIYDTNYSFSDKTISKTQEILNYDINFSEIYNYFSEKVMSFINKEEDSNEEESEKDNKNEPNSEENNNNGEPVNEISVLNNEIPEEQTNPQEVVEQVEQTSSTELNLRKLYPLILPVKRRIYNIRIRSKRINL